jgi:hypothetical protein
MDVTCLTSGMDATCLVDVPADIDAAVEVRAAA